MSMNAFEVKRFRAEIGKIFEDQIRRGIAIEFCVDPEPIKKFRTLAEAEEELSKSKYAPSVEYMKGYSSPYYIITEYAIECYEEDEDGEFIEGSDYDLWKRGSYQFVAGDNYCDIEVKEIPNER